MLHFPTNHTKHRAAAPCVRRLRRDGFSYIEILIVMLVVGVLVALLLPAVQAAREAARRINCSRNLSQMMVGVHQYEMSYGVYPTGVVNNKRPIIEAPVGYHHSWLVKILPHLEQRNTYNHVDLSKSVYHTANAPVRRLGFSVLRCPSDGGFRGPRSSYAGIHHDREAPIDVNNNGVFILNRRIDAKDVTDGLSYTMFFGEKLIDTRDLGWMSGTRSTLRNTGGVNERQPMYPFQDVSEQIRQRPIYDLEAADRLTPAQRSAIVGGLSSHHPGGVQIANGDGACNFIPETINRRALRQRACRYNDPASIDLTPVDRF